MRDNIRAIKFTEANELGGDIEQLWKVVGLQETIKKINKY